MARFRQYPAEDNPWKLMVSAPLLTSAVDSAAGQRGGDDPVRLKTGWEQPTSQPVQARPRANVATGNLLPDPKPAAAALAWGWDQPVSQPLQVKQPINTSTGTFLGGVALKYGWEQPTSEPVLSPKQPN